MSYTVAQLKTLYATAIGDASRAGRDKHVDIMAAIAMAESSGNPDAENAASTATGLWQIMFSVWVKDKDIRALGINTRGDLHDPTRNAKAAAIVYKKQGYTAWEVYNNGAYKQYLSGDPSADSPEAIVGMVNDKVGGVVTDNVSKWVRPLTDWAGNTLAVAGVAILGGVFLVLGVIILAGTTKAGKAAANLVPAGKAVKAVKAVT